MGTQHGGRTLLAAAVAVIAVTVWVTSCNSVEVTS
jgi:hypothetical protein